LTQAHKLDEARKEASAALDGERDECFRVYKQKWFDHCVAQCPLADAEAGSTADLMARIAAHGVKVLKYNFLQCTADTSRARPHRHQRTYLFGYAPGDLVMEMHRYGHKEHPIIIDTEGDTVVHYNLDQALDGVPVGDYVVEGHEFLPLDGEFFEAARDGMLRGVCFIDSVWNRHESSLLMALLEHILRAKAQ
jgi:hypothetical protein